MEFKLGLEVDEKLEWRNYPMRRPEYMKFVDSYLAFDKKVNRDDFNWCFDYVEDVKTKVIPSEGKHWYPLIYKVTTPTHTDPSWEAFLKEGELFRLIREAATECGFVVLSSRW
jgi:hypothetical protein